MKAWRSSTLRKVPGLASSEEKKRATTCRVPRTRGCREDERGSLRRRELKTEANCRSHLRATLALPAAAVGWNRLTPASNRKLTHNTLTVRSQSSPLHTSMVRTQTMCFMNVCPTLGPCLFLSLHSLWWLERVGVCFGGKRESIRAPRLPFAFAWRRCSSSSLPFR
jgi:hypothetical protein